MNLLPRFEEPSLSAIEKRHDGTPGPDFDFDDAELTINGVTFHVIADGNRTLKASTVWDAYILEWMIERLEVDGKDIDDEMGFACLQRACREYIADPAIQEVIEARYVD